jgi:hypothetical protein
MKLGLQIYAIIMATEKRCIKFNNNNKLNNLERYNIAQNYRILESGSAYATT